MFQRAHKTLIDCPPLSFIVYTCFPTGAVPNAAGTELLSCRHCFAQFLVVRGGRGRLRRTCSPKCAVARKSAQTKKYRAEKRYPLSIRKLHRKKCTVCGVGFQTTNRQTQCCGVKCGLILGKRKGDASRKANAEARRRRICNHCHREFVMPNLCARARRGEIRAEIYCSRQCAASAKRRYPDKAAAKRAERARKRKREGAVVKETVSRPPRRPRRGGSSGKHPKRPCSPLLHPRCPPPTGRPRCLAARQVPTP